MFTPNLVVRSNMKIKNNAILKKKSALVLFDSKRMVLGRKVLYVSISLEPPM